MDLGYIHGNGSFNRKEGLLWRYGLMQNWLST